MNKKYHYHKILDQLVEELITLFVVCLQRKLAGKMEVSCQKVYWHNIQFKTCDHSEYRALYCTATAYIERKGDNIKVILSDAFRRLPQRPQRALTHITAEMSINSDMDCFVNELADRVIAELPSYCKSDQPFQTANQ